MTRKRPFKLAKYMIQACGLASDSVAQVTIDGKIALMQPHPESYVYLCPLAGKLQPSHAEAWFYADCVSYEHDIPAVIPPLASEFDAFGYRYVHSGLSKPRKHTIHNLGGGKNKSFIEPAAIPARVSRRNYSDQLLIILELTRELRHGPLSYVLFRTWEAQEPVNLPYSDLYGCVQKEISLYASALRQADFLSEYLGYYRVIEAISKDNGKKWIASRLSKLKDHAFAPVAVGHSRDYGRNPKNAMAVYRRRALARLRSLRAIYKAYKKVAKYLYNANRCGIAHGAFNVIKGHIAPKYFEVGKDAVLLKLLARMAIEEKL